MKHYTKIASRIVLLITFTGLVQTVNASGFAAPVQVANPDTSPVPVRILGNASYTPFQVMLDQDAHEFSFPVPTGKRLIIEHFSAARLNANNNPTYRVIIQTQVNGVAVDHNFSQAPLIDELYQVADRQIKIYADPGTLVVATDNGTTGGGQIELSGYLEDAN
jgi:hypothetical protein